MSYYDILQVKKDSSPDEIKKSYRMLSLKHHPDKNGGNDETFKQINESYTILSDPTKRKQYDLTLSFENNIFSNLNPNMGMPFGSSFPFNFDNNVSFSSEMEDELLNHFFENILSQGSINNIFSQHGSINVPMPDIKIFTKPFKKSQTFKKIEKPEHIDVVYDITLEDLYNGKEIDIEYDRVLNNHYHEKKKLKFKLEKGVDENKVIVLENEGHVENKMCGDVHLILNTIPHDIYTKKGNDLIIEKEITLKEALCGFSIEVLHLNGKVLRLSNKSNKNIIYHGFKRSIPNYGFINGNSTGNFIIIFIVKFPKSLTKKQMDEIELILG